MAFRYKKTVEKLAKVATDQPMPALETALWWIEYVIRHDGARHLRYAGVDMPLYQYLLLDVIAFVVVALGTIIFILLKTLTIFKHIVLCYRFVQRMILKSIGMLSRQKQHKQ